MSAYHPLLKGAIELHCHSHPSIFPRRQTDWELIEDVKKVDSAPRRRRFLAHAAEAWVSRNEMAQVFLNIILNALQAIGDAGGVLRVSVRDAGETWTVEISDTGKGIHPNHLPRIFNPFYSTKPSGTGLGLSVAHEIMIRHGGTIRAESEEGKGATLILQIPKCFYPQGSEGRLHETDFAGG